RCGALAVAARGGLAGRGRLGLAGTCRVRCLGLAGCGLARLGRGEVAPPGLGLTAIGLARGSAAGLAEALADPGVAVGDVAAMAGIVTPSTVDDVGAIELVEAINIDVGAIAPPVESA